MSSVFEDLYVARLRRARATPGSREWWRAIRDIRTAERDLRALVDGIKQAVQGIFDSLRGALQSIAGAVGTALRQAQEGGGDD